MANTTAFVAATTGPQFIVSGKTGTPGANISVTANSPATNSQLIEFNLSNTFASSPTLVGMLGLGTVADPTGAGTFTTPNTGLLEVGTVGGDPNATIFAQRLNVTAPNLLNGESEIDNLSMATATSATPGGPINSNIAEDNLGIFFISPPLITGTVANQPVASNGTIKPFATAGITDTDFQNKVSNPATDVASITVTDGGTPTDNDGILVGAGLSKTGVGTYTIPNAVSPAMLATELQNLSFNAPNVFGTHTVNFELDVQDVPPATTTSAVAGETVPPDLTSKDTTTSVSVVGAPAPPAGNNFHIVDTTTGQVIDTPGVPYTGPVAGIQNQYIVQDENPAITSDNLNISGVTPNVFIHSGPGTDALDVSGTNGTNILDGGTGSNFLVGGTGNDTFFLDDRNATADIFSTVRNLHGGDTITVWGVTQKDFTIKPGDNVLPTVPGLDIAITAPGQKNANIDIPNYSTADLSNGKLVMSFGTTPDMPGLPGSPYMLIQAT